MKTISARFALSLATVLLCGVSASAFAAPLRDTEIVTRTVRFADLDLSTADGAQALYGRIKRAASFVCREEFTPRIYDCRARALEMAVQDVGSPLLVSIHRSSTGRTEEVVVR